MLDALAPLTFRCTNQLYQSDRRSPLKINKLTTPLIRSSVEVLRGNSQGTMTQTPHENINITAILQGVTGMGVSEPMGRDVRINSTPSSTVLDDFMQHRPIQPPPRPRDKYRLCRIAARKTH